MRKLDIFLVDDDSDDRELFQNAANSCIDQIRSLCCFENGAELLKALFSSITLPTIIVADLNMPCMGGIECVGQIRANSKFNEIPIVVLTTSVNSTDIDNVFAAGASGYAVKPDSFSELKKLVCHILSIDWRRHIPKSKFVIKV